ncbi:MAG TPA: short-chain fatty acyl-CoA regulator family protein [Gemmatimonadaceae bacterium]|nr:short-chain fatty acyl-CoA regulator family protein [Gemmatimonadaceae bacterium]
MVRGGLYGRRIRALRHRCGLSQAAFAERLGISTSYLNLLENDRRALTTDLLLRLARTFELDLHAFAGDDTAQLSADLVELFGDPLFEEHPLTRREILEFASNAPDIARAVVRMHHALLQARASADSLAERLVDHQDVAAMDRVSLSSEQVTEFLERHRNYFPELETAAEALWRDAALEPEELGSGLARHLARAHGVRVRILTVAQMRGAVRRFDAAAGELQLSEVLRRGSRHFQLAIQVALLRCPALLERLADDPLLTSDESRALCRMALASYFAAAVLMPYTEFLRAAEELRYDVELLGHRFRVSFEQTCHRLTTLRRPGAEGVEFYMVRVDMAGNISKKLGAAGIRFPRFSGLCALWNVHAAFLQPGRVRVQLSRFPDGRAVFAVARTVQRHAGGYHAPQVLYTVGIGCSVSDARRLVYADGVDLDSERAAVPVGVTCRLCERTACQARAFPALDRPLRIDENVRGISFFAPVSGG